MRLQLWIFFMVLLIFHCLPCSTWTAFPFVFAISLCSYEATLNITVFGHWQGSSLSEYYVSSWIIPTEFHRCPVMCRWAWLGCMAGISLPIAVGDIVSVHTKALLHVLSIHLSVRYFYKHIVPWENFILNPGSNAWVASCSMKLSVSSLLKFLLSLLLIF